MKHQLIALATLVFFAGTILNGCQSSVQKVENAQEKLQNAKLDVASANKELKVAIQDTLAEYQQFKKSSEDSIRAHEISISVFKNFIANAKIENRAIYEEKLVVLEKQNNELKKKLENYKYEEQTSWTTFRTEFMHDLAELGKALKDFTVKSS